MLLYDPRFIEDVGLEYVVMPKNRYRRWSNLTNQYFREPSTFLRTMDRAFTCVPTLPEETQKADCYVIWKRNTSIQDK